MKTNRHLLSASNVLLSLNNDQDLSRSEKLAIIDAIDTMLVTLHIKVLETYQDTIPIDYQERVIDAIEKFNKSRAFDSEGQTP